MRALLDINVLLALWASCAITQNGFVRIISQPRYPSPIPVAHAVERLSGATRGEHHEFWSCDLSLLDERLVDRTRIHGHRQVTDAYLLALAVARGGRFVTFDRAIPRGAVYGAGPEDVVVL
jgi:toxin-antitoxin system PIN domain toxin